MNYLFNTPTASDIAPLYIIDINKLPNPMSYEDFVLATAPDDSYLTALDNEAASIRGHIIDTYGRRFLVREKSYPKDATTEQKDELKRLRTRLNEIEKARILNLTYRRSLESIDTSFETRSPLETYIESLALDKLELTPFENNVLNDVARFDYITTSPSSWLNLLPEYYHYICERKRSKFDNYAFNLKLRTVILYFHPDLYEEILNTDDNPFNITYSLLNDDDELELMFGMDNLNEHILWNNMTSSFEHQSFNSNTNSGIFDIIKKHYDMIKNNVTPHVNFKFIYPRVNAKTGTMKNLMMQSCESEWMYITDEDDIVRDIPQLMDIIREFMKSKEFEIFNARQCALVTFNRCMREHANNVALWNSFIYVPRLKEVDYNQTPGLIDGEDYGTYDLYADRRMYGHEPFYGIYAWRGSSDRSRRKEPVYDRRVTTLIDAIKRSHDEPEPSPYLYDVVSRINFMEDEFYHNYMEDERPYEEPETVAYVPHMDLPVMFYVVREVERMMNAVSHDVRDDELECKFVDSKLSRRIEIVSDASDGKKKFYIHIKDGKRIDPIDVTNDVFITNNDRIEKAIAKHPEVSAEDIPWYIDDFRLELSHVKKMTNVMNTNIMIRKINNGEYIPVDEFSDYLLNFAIEDKFYGGGSDGDEDGEWRKKWMWLLMWVIVGVVIVGVIVILTMMVSKPRRRATFDETL